MKKMKIFLAIILLLIVVVTGLIWWQHNNIKMAYYSYKFDNTQIDNEIQKNNDEVDTYLREKSSFNVRPSTDIEQKLHKAKLITDKEFVQILTGKTDVKTIFGIDVSYDETSNSFVTLDGDKLSVDELVQLKDDIKEKNISNGVSANGSLSDKAANSSTAPQDKSDNQKNAEKASDVSSSPNSTVNKSASVDGDYTDSGNRGSTVAGAYDYPANSSSKPNSGSNTNLGNDQNPGDDVSQSEPDSEKASECIAQMYVIKSTFESRLDGLYSEAKAYYSQLVAEDKKNIKSEMIKQFYPQATSLEGQCDQKVESVLSELTSVLEASGDETEIVDKIRDMYNKEKSLKKAYYLNLAK